MGLWILTRNPSSGVVDEVSSPGAFGTFPWVDRKRDLRGIIFMFTASGFSTTAINNLKFLADIRLEIDSKGLPSALPKSPLSLTRDGDFLKLQWQGDAFETSSDLQTWTPLPCANSPFLERVNSSAIPSRFYAFK